MSSVAMPEVEYVSQKMFDIRFDDIKYRTNTDRERMEDRLDKFQAIMEKNFAEMRTVISDFRGEVQGEIKELRGEIKNLNIRVDGVEKRIDGVEKRIDDINQSQNKWFSLFGVLLTVISIAFTVVAFFK